MSWMTHHSQSERYASLAEIAYKERDLIRAMELYKRAAEAEVLALADLDKSKTRTLGVTAVSAASLWYKANDFRQAQNTIYQWLGTDLLPSFAIQQLQNLLQTIWAEEAQEKAGISFVKGDVLISVSGGEVVTGGAPLDLILRKIDEVRGIFYRTIEMLLAQPFRRHGSPNLEIQQQCRPWLFQAPPGSYQFAVRVQQPKQMKLFPDAIPKIEHVTEKFIEILKASSDDPEGRLQEVVPDPEYRSTFLKLARNLAPSGTSFTKLVIKSAGEVGPPPVVLVPDSRELINEAIKRPKVDTPISKTEQKETQLRGILRALHLDKDWIEVTIFDEGEQHIKVYETGDVIDDVVGPMVNRRVIVDVLRKPNGKHIYRDIQSEE